ncbi:hypothetical protein D3OALGA1CA_3524 [Olavius algarvensis associated proteobacterium Delta 3]|nr:hypothetical protein D3OALGB2SA_3779 [Olavius algarvensis associated proteobacterium Delta 3]CAB5135748.1 hypothetical protein D3OALGA1CA_3524 [Olavius algarvensis associated proteobacterium Delta 3]
MLYLDVEILSEAIRRVDTKIESIGWDPELSERSLFIALVYERLMRGETQAGFFELCSMQVRSLDGMGAS